MAAGIRRAGRRPPAWAVGVVVIAMSGGALAAESCQWMVRGSDGQLRMQDEPTLVVSALVPGRAFAIPPQASASAVAVQCVRDSLMPGANDFKVLSAGLPLSIASGDRVGVLELEAGRAQFRMLDGQLTGEEAARMATRLDELAREFNQAAHTAP